MITTNIVLIVWFSVVQLTLVHSTSVAHTICANISNETHFNDTNDGHNFLYYKSNVIGDEFLNYIVDDTTVVLCIEAVTQQTMIHVANKTNIALCGLLDSHTEVRCHGNESGYKFTNVRNLTLSHIAFMNCGSPALDTQDTVTVPWLSGVWFYDCESVRLTNINVRNSTGTGIAFFDVTGYVEIKDSSFENSNIHNEHNFTYGVCVRFSSGKLKEDVYKTHKRVCKIVFHNDSFINNNVSLFAKRPLAYPVFRDKEKSTQFGLGGGLALQFNNNDSWYTKKVIVVTNCTFKLNTAHHGGGMNLNFTHNTTRNNITIEHCNFTNNRADFGGGLSVIFSNNPYNNSVLLSHLRFSENHAEKGGGGMEIGFHFQQMKQPETNTITIKNCQIVENQALYGGGTVLYYSRAKLATQKYVIRFINCLWEKNKALFGSAVEASLHASDKLPSGYMMSPIFRNCQFMSNYRFEEIYTASVDRKNLARLSWGKGVFLTTALPILFKDRTTFFGSNTSALRASSSIVEFAAGSNVNFTSNTGFEGGAVSLIGLSELHVMDNSTFIFYNNTALTKGGAIIYRSGNKLDFVSSRRCFIRYIGNTTVVSKRAITITFENNTAYARGHTMFATTLIPCRRVCINYTNLLGCIGNVTYTHRSHDVSTDGAVFALPKESRMAAIPGKELTLNFTLLDENSEKAYGSYHVTVPRVESDRTGVILDSTYSYIIDKTIKLYGEPGQRVQVVITTSNFRDIAATLEVEMEQCPPGFVTQTNHKNKGIECVCSASTVDKTYFGIHHCTLNSYRAYLIHGYWIGYDSANGSESTLRSGYCPRGFCVRKKFNETEILLPLEPSKAILNNIICGKYRTGKLCGSCSNGTSVYYHSNSYYCDNDQHCRFGLLLYLVSEIVPVTILFTTILLFNVKFTSGTLNGFIFFVQFIDTMLIDANGFISTHRVLDTFTSIYQFLYRMFNLNFFTLDKLSFCLWRGANTLDILAFKYVTVVYSIILVIITVLLMKGKHSCFRKQKFLESSSRSVKSTIIHGFSAFFVMCYSQCAKVTLFILNPGRVHSVGKVNHNNITPVVFYHGDYKYLQGGHIKYALPASIFGVTIVLIPPLLLVIYPLCYKILALLRIEETRCISILCRIMPLESMKPIFDSFQSCFRDKYRFFAGFYFLYRLVALVSFLITDSLTKFYIALEVQLIVMLTLQATTYPYHRRWHNIIDILLFANLAVINALTMYNYKKAKEINDNTRSINAVSAIQTILISVPFVCMACFIITTQLTWRVKRSKKQERSRDELTDTLALVDYRQLEDSK